MIMPDTALKQIGQRLMADKTNRCTIFTRLKTLLRIKIESRKKNFESSLKIVLGGKWVEKMVAKDKTKWLVHLAGEGLPPAGTVSCLRSRRDVFY